MYKRFLFVMILILIISSVFTGCSDFDSFNSSNDKLSVVATIFPEYDWVSNIVEGNDNAELTLLMNNGTDMHSFQPTADDILKISTCDVFIYVGGESDTWVEDVLKEAVNEDMTVINLMEVLDDEVKEEEMIEGMESEEHNHNHDEDAEDNENDKYDEDEIGGNHEEDEIDGNHDEAEGHNKGKNDTEYDEHVWLSIRNAKTAVKYISQKLQEADSDNKSLYEENTASYIEELDALDKEYEETVNTVDNPTLVFGDRFPFRYLVDDYNIEYYAAFPGCSAETEASFETIVFLAGKVDEYNLPVVLTIEKSDKKIAETIVENTENKNQEILELNSMQSVTEKEIKGGATYISCMKSNLEVLKKCFGADNSR